MACAHVEIALPVPELRDKQRRKRAKRLMNFAAAILLPEFGNFPVKSPLSPTLYWGARQALGNWE